MPDKDRPLVVEIPRPADDRPAWSRVGVVGAVGFVIGIAWPRLAGVQIGPSIPGDARGTDAAASAQAVPAAAAAPGSAAPAAASAAPANKQLVLVGPGKLVRCSDKKGNKVDECGKLAFDPIAQPKLKELATCPAALGLEGKLVLGVDVDFDKREVQFVKGKKTNIPNSTLQGIMKCAAQEFGAAELEKVVHEHRRYVLHYQLSFHPPGKHPEDAAAADKGEDGADDEAPSKGSETEASGSATVSWDTALLRKEPKDGDVVARIVRGTKVKIVARQSDWFKVEHGTKSGWVYRGAIGM
jgi:hypothetical protein